MANTKIYATETEGFDIGAPVLKWNDKEGLDFIPNKNYYNTNCKDLKSLQNVIKQFTVHWSVTYRARPMFNGLNAQKISCNFMIDDDCNNDGFATIFQCLPMNKLGYSQGSHTNGVSFNRLGPGVELSYMPQRWEGDQYTDALCKRHNVPKHDTKKASVHGTTLTIHVPTVAQMKSLKSLIWGFGELFPNLPATFPRDTTVLKDPLNYKGLVTHYQLTRRKIDVAGLEFDEIEKDVKEMKDVKYNIFRKIK